jgi:hypothetical protein
VVRECYCVLQSVHRVYWVNTGTVWWQRLSESFRGVVSVCGVRDASRGNSVHEGRTLNQGPGQEERRSNSIVKTKQCRAEP